MQPRKILIDTDFGGDPDDVLTVLYALQSTETEIAGIITSDEYEGNQRARSLQYWLDSFGKSVPVFSGRDLGNRNIFFLQKYLSDKTLPSLEDPALEPILKDIAESKGAIVGVASSTNIKYLEETYPDYVQKTSIYMMGGAFKYNPPEAPEHNIWMDIPAAKSLFHSPLDISWITWECTSNSKLSISPEHKLYKYYAQGPEEWKKIIKINMDGFYQNIYPSSFLNDPLTLSCVYAQYVSIKDTKVAFLEDGRWEPSENDNTIKMSVAVDYEAFLKDFMQKCMP